MEVNIVSKEIVEHLKPYKKQNCSLIGPSSKSHCCNERREAVRSGKKLKPGCRASNYRHVFTEARTCSCNTCIITLGHCSHEFFALDSFYGSP